MPLRQPRTPSKSPEQDRLAQRLSCSLLLPSYRMPPVCKSIASPPPLDTQLGFGAWLFSIRAQSDMYFSFVDCVWAFI
jgi:hypothetical protein